MKYQKSMMKIMEKLIYNKNRENSIESIIKDAHTGRNSSFYALKWLEKNGFVKIKSFGNQKRVSVVIDNYTLAYKYYLDSVELKTFDSFIKLIVMVFVSQLYDKQDVKSVILFGSVLKKNKYNDIDLLLLGDKLSVNSLNDFLKIREKIERVFGVIINLHMGKLNINNLFKGIVVYQSSYFNFNNDVQKQYFEFLSWILESIKSKKDRKMQKIAFSNAIVNLSYVYCHLNSIEPKTKEDALHVFKSKYNVHNLEDLKKRGIEIGKEIFN